MSTIGITLGGRLSSSIIIDGRVFALLTYIIQSRHDFLESPQKCHHFRYDVTKPCPLWPKTRLLQITLVGCLSLCAFGSMTNITQAQSPNEPNVADPKEQEEQEKMPVGEVRLEGQVTNSTGAGLAGVQIDVFECKDDGTKGAQLAKTQTDDFGDFQIRTKDDIHAEVIVAITKVTFKTIEHKIHLGDESYPPYLAETLTGNLSLAGMVVSAADGLPVSKADVTMTIGYDEKHVETGADGKFSFKGVSRGAVDLVVEADHFGRESLTVDDVETAIDGANPADDIRIELKPERVLSLSIVNDQDEPIAGATVELLDGPRNDFRTLVTDDKGLAMAHGIHFDADKVTLRLSHSDYVSDVELSRSISLPEKQAASSHKLVMQRAGNVEALVFDSDGEPLYGARVLAGGNAENALPRDWTNDRGRCLITGILPGETAITAHMAGYAPQLKVVEVKAGETARIKLTLDSPATLSGKVNTDKGDPVASVEVVATTWRGYQTLGLRAYTDKNGKFDMPNAPHDEFEVIVMARGATDKPITVKAGTTIPVELTIPEVPEGGFPGSTSSPKIGDPVPDVTVTSMDGQVFKLREMKGKVILIDFWATWCGPCVAELPGLIKLHKKFSQREDFMMISVSLDFDKATLVSFLKKKKDITWPQIYGEKSGSQAAATSFGAEALPAMFIIDVEGNVAASWLRGSAIEKKVAELLDTKVDAKD